MGIIEMASNYLVPIAATAVLSWLLTGLATRYSVRAGLVDRPGERHSHHEPTPRGGGAGLVLAMVVATIGLAAGQLPTAWNACIVPGAVAIALLGWQDDHRSLGVGLRFVVQLAVSLYLLGCAASAGWLAGAWSGVVALVFILWMTNLYNFMDGSNGMAGLQGVYAGCALAWLFVEAGDASAALLAALLAAACAGFLPWNLGRARVFMGDVGSLFLGFGFGAVLVYGTGSGALGLPVALMLMGVFLADGTLTLASRVIRGERWYNAHRQHLYQRMIAHGWSHFRVAVLYQALNLLLVLPGIWVAVRFPALAWPVAIGMALFLGLGWLLMSRKFGVLAQAG
jgi:UDP-N-acetylmuramyl pentapeptide phosphotransferase/UDP-N-acetylglucosamine-1-phosphate transferase